MRSVYFFAGGGTGGHLYPALAITQEIARLDPGARCEFLCSDRPLDAQILSAAGASWHALPARPPGLRPGAFARFVISWGPSVRTVRRRLSEALDQGGSVKLVAMGGFVAAPAAQGARVTGIPVMLVNLDAVPGRANRWIAKRAAVRISAAEGEHVPPDWRRIPPIVRREAVACAGRAECRVRAGLQPELKTLFVTGGSQGAGSINELMIALLRREPALLAGWQVLHQTGGRGSQAVRDAYAAAGVPSRVEEFWSDMGSAWGAADAAISRCGAGAVGEVWANRVPTLFLPYPYHKDQHQRFNALPLERAGGAWIVEDRIDPARTLDNDGAERLRGLLGDEQRRQAMRTALASLGPADGARRAAEALVAPFGR